MLGKMKNNAARKDRSDEYYTQYDDIERECGRYDWRGKSVICPCDDYEYSEFARWFGDHFDDLGLARLVVIGMDVDADGAPSYSGRGRLLDRRRGRRAEKRAADGNGDFRAAETRRLLRECDIAATNPPFSLFSEFVAALFGARCGALIIGSAMSAVLSAVWPRIAGGELRYGYNDFPGGKPPTFLLPGGALAPTGPIYWYTTLPTPGKKRGIEFNRLYPRYDNFDAIDVRRVAWIPGDYWGVMGVPVTYLPRHDPAQFEIVGCNWDGSAPKTTLGGKQTFRRVFIRRRPGSRCASGRLTTAAAAPALPAQKDMLA